MPVKGLPMVIVGTVGTAVTPDCILPDSPLDASSSSCCRTSAYTVEGQVRDAEFTSMSPEAMTILASMGSRGNSAMRLPSLVSSPWSFSAPRAYSCSSALKRVSVGGGSMKSKFIRSLMPKDFSISTTFPACACLHIRLLLWLPQLTQRHLLRPCNREGE